MSCISLIITQLFGEAVHDIAYVTLRNKDFKEVTLQVSEILIQSCDSMSQLHHCGNENGGCECPESR